MEGGRGGCNNRYIYIYMIAREYGYIRNWTTAIQPILLKLRVVVQEGGGGVVAECVCNNRY